MTRKKKLLRQRIKRLSVAGWSQTEIADRCKISRITCRDYQKSLGLPTRQQPKVDAGELYQIILHTLDSIYPKQLPYGAEHDPAFAAAFVAALAARRPSYFAQHSRSNREELTAFVRSSLFIKRSCSNQENQGMVH
jgi:hypothetical protein